MITLETAIDKIKQLSAKIQGANCDRPYFKD